MSPLNVSVSAVIILVRSQCLQQGPSLPLPMFLLNRQIDLHRLTVLERHPLQQQFDLICSAYSAPAFFSLLDQLERQPKKSCTRFTIAGMDGPILQICEGDWFPQPTNSTIKPR